jgi:4,5-dihydroxyphthalate decarboxylase
MVRGLEFDITEMAITTYICARAHDKPITAIPVFLMRQFHHGGILHNTDVGIRTPKDLEGKRVGINRGYTVTAGLWARSILQHEHDVDLKSITWVLSGDEHVAEYKAPANVVPIEEGKKLDEMLVSGEIPAATGVQLDAPNVTPLIPNALEAGLEAVRQRGLYPINHTLVVKNEVLEAHPELAVDIFNTFAAAKDLYVQRLKAGQIEEPSEQDKINERVMEISGDPLPYGVESNRVVLEAILQYCMEQGILTKPFSVEELFAAGTHRLSA